MNGLQSDKTVLDTNSIMLDAVTSTPTVRPRDGLGSNKSDWDEFDDNNSDIATALKVSFAPTSRPLEVGASWYRGKWDNAGDRNLSMYGAHLNYLEKNWTLKGEYVRSDVEQVAGNNIVTAAGPASVNTSTGDYNMYAWYVEGSYIPYRFGANDKHYVRLIARYDDVDTNDKATFTPFDRSRITLGTEVEFLNNTRIRYEWQAHKIDGFENAPAPYVAAGGRENVYMNMVSLIAYF